MLTNLIIWIKLTNALKDQNTQERPSEYSQQKKVKVRGYHSHENVTWKSEGIFADVIKTPNQFDFQFIKREIIPGGPDLTKWALYKRSWASPKIRLEASETPFFLLILKKQVLYSQENEFCQQLCELSSGPWASIRTQGLANTLIEALWGPEQRTS